MTQLRLSIVVAVHNMRREVPRTLKTLTAEYQDIRRDCYELIVVENGSSEPLGEASVSAIDPSFQYRWSEPGDPSPAAAINAAVRQSRGEAVAVLIDGTCMLSPGFLRYSLLALRAYRRPLISTLGCHLGSSPQQQAAKEGYDAGAEDQLLESVPWQRNGYELFRIACLASSSKFGILAPLAESKALVMRRQMFDELGGLEEGFTCPGGGLVNLDFYQRAQALPEVQLVTLLGEASFQQIHGAATTGAANHWQVMTEEFAVLRGRPFDPYPRPWPRPDFLGQIRPMFRPWLSRALAELRPLEQAQPSSAYANRSHPERFASAQQRVVAVLGMHRSGTSMLTGTLQEAGLVLGDVVTAAPHNRKGNREALPIRTLHDDLLASAGGDWRSPPEAVVWRPVHRLLRDGLIERFADQPLWGFKDPRSLFCLEGWREALPQMEAVAIVRHPLEVAASLQARDGLPLAEGVVLWERYNRRLLYWIEELDCPLLVFEPEAEVIKQKLAGLIKRLDLPRQLGPEELRFFAGELRHQGHAARELGILPASVRQLHQQLLERAFQA